MTPELSNTNTYTHQLLNHKLNHQKMDSHKFHDSLTCCLFRLSQFYLASSVHDFQRVQLTNSPI